MGNMLSNNHHDNEDIIENEMLRIIKSNSRSLLELRNYNLYFNSQNMKLTSQSFQLNAKLELQQFYDIDFMELYNLATGLGFLVVYYKFENNNKTEVVEEFKLICRKQNISFDSFYFEEVLSRTRLFLKYYNDQIITSFCISRIAKSIDICEIQKITIDIMYDLMNTMIDDFPKDIIILIYQYWVGIVRKSHKISIKIPYYNPITKELVHHPETIIK